MSKQVILRLTKRQAELVKTEMYAAVCNGAEDKDYEGVYEKAVAALRQFNAAHQQGRSDEGVK